MEQPRGEAFLNTARLLFDVLDATQSGTIDVQELMVLTRRLLHGQGRASRTPDDLEKLARQAVARHGDGEVLSFDEFELS